MTVALKVTLADNTASDAWTAAGLGSFDESKAEKMDANGDGKVTETEITSYQSTTATTPSTDNVTYSVVNIDQAPESCDEMKKILTQCMTSFDGIASFVKGLVAKSTNIGNQIQTLNGEIDNISADDGTGSGTNSAYSLTLAGEESATKNDKTSVNVQKLGTKPDEVKTLVTESVQVSTKLTKASTDLQTTSDSANKIMDKVGGAPIGLDKSNGEKIAGGGATGALAGAAVGGTCAIMGHSALGYVGLKAALVSSGVGLVIGVGVIAAVCIFKSIFGHKRDQKAEVRQMGQEVQKHCEAAQEAIAQTNDAISKTGNLSDTLNSTLSKKTGELEDADRAIDEQKNGTKQTTETTNPFATTETKKRKEITGTIG